MDPRQQPFLMPFADNQSDATGQTGSRAPAPTPNELLLTRRLAQIEKERDNMAAELARVKLSQKETSGIIITPDIISVLSLLRSHIAALTRDNEALRHTFLGTRTGSSSKLTQETSRITDLEDVVSRVKELIQENEELGEMVLETGKEGVEEYQRALEDAKAVITSLDSDLEHHACIVDQLRSELEGYKAHFGPLPERPTKPNGRNTGRNTPLQRGRMSKGNERAERANSGKPGTAEASDTRTDGRSRDGRRGRGARGRGIS